jgi:predicted O-linked N-acetylglucosamine transferase (SPINDLY family)
MTNRKKKNKAAPELLRQIVHPYSDKLSLANSIISKAMDAPSKEQRQQYRMQAIHIFEEILCHIPLTDYLLIDSTPILPENSYIESHFKLGTLYKNYVEEDIQILIKNMGNKTSGDSQIGNNILCNNIVKLFEKALDSFRLILKVKFENDLATQQIVSIYSQLCYLYQKDIGKSLEYMQGALLYAPCNPSIHYNLGLLYQKTNRLELSLIHYKISVEFCKAHIQIVENKRLALNCYNGLSGLFRALKQWPDALYYLRQAEVIDPSDPDIQNQLGVVYTEMRRTDLAEKAYNKALTNYDKAFISTDSKYLLAEIHLNMGHMHSYNGNNHASIDCYNKSLQVFPKFIYPFQNKIMNLSYMFDELGDKMYILNQHKLVNKIFKKKECPFIFSKKYFTTSTINIGIVSGDFIDHPVQFFISTFLRNFDTVKFKVTCYSECVIDTSLYSSNLNFKLIKNVSADDVAQMIYTDKIHILMDLAGHTAFNRLDVFALKPAPIQLSYIGYPYSTGLNEMDYRITDRTCDNEVISQPFYTEKLLFLNHCFLCYDPTIIKRDKEYKYIHPSINVIQPFVKNEFLTIACFNRLNKITDSVIKMFNNILLTHSNVKFVFKTKGLLNKIVQTQFMNKFDKIVRERIKVLNCTITHEEHLSTYNDIDIAIDTFPYSGTTTSCEALLQGVPVFTLHDKQHYFHAQNVTASILLNSNSNELSFYVCNTESEIIERIGVLLSKPSTFWENMKKNVRNIFLNGNVCNQEKYMQNIQSLLVSLYNKHCEI